MIKTLIIEDEINPRQVLVKMLKVIEPDIEIIGETGFVSEAVKMINTLKPDLLFLDIELEDGSGFDILKQIETFSAKIIFITAYNQYAINAFKYSAVDYLLKPIDPIDLQEAVKRAKKSINNETEHKELLVLLKNNINKKGQKIVLKTSEQRYVISVNDIIRLEADGAYTLFITNDQKIIISKNIKYYQELLDGSVFIRCHQSHLINKNHIKGINNSGKLIMSNNDLVSISSRKKSEIKHFIAEL